MTNNTITGPYVRRGILLGLIFPIAAMIICIFILTPDDYPVTFLGLHHDFPLLWIIDSAPFVLGLVSYIVGVQVSKSNMSFLTRITDINSRLSKKNQQLEDLIGEKEILLKEVHHRVKNNLQIITSLLSLQASFIEEDKTKALFRYSQYRINSMAMIHEMLYKSEDILRIDYGQYAEKLVQGLILSMKGSENNVKFDIDVPKMDLNIDTAIPLGLLINEVVTNSLKYGIKGQAEGTIHLKIKQIEGGQFLMEIGDNGVGFPEDLNFRNSNSLGLMLIHKLAIQLRGNIEKDNSLGGTNYLVNFSEIIQTS
ncbi:MAG: sensor histidine kinase [Crocinitomicaceae bacterium]|nr:sensor histidine kinase [Crocinitomicaceae bacterium]